VSAHKMLNIMHLLHTCHMNQHRAVGHTLHFAISLSLTILASTSSSSCHHDSACGLVVVRCGNPPTLDAQSSFVYPRDAFIINEHTKKPVCIAQKPVAFSQRLIQLFTMEGEWVMSGFSAIGML